MVFIFFLFGSCAEKTGIPYNDAIILPQKDMVANLDSLINKTGNDMEAIEKFRNRLVEKANTGLHSSMNLKEFHGNTSFRDAGIDYFNYAIEFFGSTPDIDSMLYKLKSKEPFKAADSNRIEATRSALERFVELETILLDEQQKFLKEFNVQAYQIPEKLE